MQWDAYQSRRTPGTTVAEEDLYIGGIFEKDLTNGEPGTETKYYFAGGSRVAMRTGGTLRYLAGDHLGSTAFVMNAAGGLESHVRYHPYGMTWSQSSIPATDRLFTGHQQMGAKSGTYYANARFYSADIGRFPEPDALVGGGYAYAGNNPTNNVDPTGNDFVPSCVCPAHGINGGGISGGGPRSVWTNVALDALGVVGIYDPTGTPGAPCWYKFWGDCSGVHDRWVEQTRRAAKFLEYMGLDINALPWDANQRADLWNAGFGVAIAVYGQFEHHVQYWLKNYLEMSAAAGGVALVTSATGLQKSFLDALYKMDTREWGIRVNEWTDPDEMRGRFRGKGWTQIEGEASYKGGPAVTFRVRVKFGIPWRFHPHSGLRAFSHLNWRDWFK